MTNFTITYSDSNEDLALLVIRGDKMTQLAPGVSKNFDITEDLEQVTIRTVKHSPLNPEVMEHDYQGTLNDEFNETPDDVDRAIADGLIEVDTGQAALENDAGAGAPATLPAGDTESGTKPDDPDADATETCKASATDTDAIGTASTGDGADNKKKEPSE